ncbi:MAG: peptide deformylase [Desulfitobacteriaceae bacterium]|nr:peptide deformylase [Desulfitobacteriaceae bacterium]
MAVYQIVKLGDPVLREVAKKVPKITPNIIKLLENMKDTMHEARGVGLAAPQIGISKRVVVIDVGEGLFELINPVIVAQEGKEIDAEGCLSIPGVEAEVLRAEKVTVEALNRHGEKFTITGKGLLARALQHETDHLDGILFIDKQISK